MICKACGTIQRRGKVHTPGSIGIELVLWLMFLVPGLIYSLWRHSNRLVVCAACGYPELANEDSPVGRRLVQMYHPDGIPKPAPRVRGLVHWLAVGLLALLVGVVTLAAVTGMLVGR